jgi:hypothetical protein
MSTLQNLDDATSELAGCVFSCPPDAELGSGRISFRKIVLDASLQSTKFRFHLDDGRLDKGSSPSHRIEARLDDLALRHWKSVQDLDQPRWYTMTVNVERSGKYSVDFEYRDNYRDGDIEQAL